MIRRSLTVTGAVLLLAVGGLTACSDDDGGPGGGERPAATGTASTADRVQALAEQHLKIDEVQPIGSGEAMVDISGSKKRAVAEVLTVRAGDRSTVLRWRLRTPDATGRILPGSFSRRSTDDETSAIALVPVGTQQRFVSGRYQQGTLFGNCTCPPAPWVNGPEGVEMSSIFAALDGDVQQVQVRIPGFPAITVPVTRE